MEQNAYAPIGNRLSRFTAANGPGVPKLAWVIVDSGHQYTNGIIDYARVYKDLVDKELARPPMADVNATFLREGNHFTYEVFVKNLSGVTLSTQANSATVNVIVYEDVKPAYGVQTTSRVVRAVVTKPLDSGLLNNGSARYTLQTKDLLGVNWTKLHSVAFAEYRPGGTTGAYDMLQAAIPMSGWFQAQPDSLAFLIDPLNPQNQEQTIQMAGSPTTITWSASESVNWLTVTPSSGHAGDTAIVRVDANLLKPGTYSGMITVTAVGEGKSFSQTIPVQVEYPRKWEMFLPIGLK